MRRIAGFAWLIVSRGMSVRQQVVHATPAWMIPVVGTLNISIAGVTVNLPGAHPVSAFGLAVGLFFAVPLFTLILSRLIFEEPMLPSQQPSLLILVATFAVGISSYLAVVGRMDIFASSLFISPYSCSRCWCRSCSACAAARIFILRGGR